ncbi:hypothetical protein N7495_007751 [Penicillium taxi]|uniref:uncharacterized protein n=1 Tax=Penicillium taxi TaxID=168475 RepID=UPI002544F1CB|nr:uncharacterized protein N7495_007751 [Penicillium taxi]KAJ5887710.1 hypothetical protein N7495_007751 [Penicillium taxi]
MRADLDEEPRWIITKPAMKDGGSACLQILEGYHDWVNSVVFSHNSSLLASAYNKKIAKI